MAAGSTYTPIATTTVSGSSTNRVTFSSIPSTYTDLRVIFNGGSASGTIGMYYGFNNDPFNTGLYSVTYLSGNGSSATSGRASNQNFIYAMNLYTTTPAVITADIMNYSNTTTNKTVLQRPNNAGQYLNAEVALWRSTSAINQIDFYTGGAFYYSSGSTFTLYGIQAA
jgi:hypothetical protein